MIRLDPGLAFGTGTHPTTRMCLRWIAQRSELGPRQCFDRVLDYGCGSGILAIAGLLLGARAAWAVDIDPQALTATRDNAARNGVGARLATGLPQALPRDATFDLLLANILAGPLVELAPALAARLT